MLERHTSSSKTLQIFPKRNNNDDINYIYDKPKTGRGSVNYVSTAYPRCEQEHLATGCVFFWRKYRHMIIYTHMCARAMFIVMWRIRSLDEYGQNY